MNRIMKAIVADHYNTYNNLVFTAIKNIVNMYPVNTYINIINRISALMTVDPFLKSAPITPKEVMGDLLDQETQKWFVKEACTRAGKFNKCSNRFYANLATIAFAMEEQMKLISSEEFGGLFTNTEAIIKIDNPNGDELYIILDDVDQIVIIKPENGMSVFELGLKLEYLMRRAKSFARNHQKSIIVIDDDNDEEEEEENAIDTEGAYMPTIDELFTVKHKCSQLLFNEHETYHERKELLSALLKKSQNLFGLPIGKEAKYPNLSEFLQGWNVKPEEIERALNKTEWIKDITAEITDVDIFDTNISMRWRVGSALNKNMKKLLYTKETSENNPVILDNLYPDWKNEDKIVITVDNLILIINSPKYEGRVPNNIIAKIIFIDNNGNPYPRNLKGEYTKNENGQFEIHPFDNTKFEGYGKSFIKMKIEQIINK